MQPSVRAVLETLTFENPTLDWIFMSRTRNPGAKREAILGEARLAFSRHGFDVTVADIAASAGVSEGIVFHHFGSKHGLLEAGAEAEATEFVARELRAHADGLDYDRLATSIFEWVGSDRMVRRLWTEGDDRIVGSLRRGWHRAVVAGVSTALVKEQAAGRCRPGDTELFARMQFAVVGELLIAHFDQPDLLSLQDAVDETARAVRAIVAPTHRPA